MTKLIVFDLDGVLVDSKDIHFNALNLALNDIDSSFVISRPEQDLVYEGLTTRTKLNILSKEKGLSELDHEKIWQSKQAYSSILFLGMQKDLELVLMMNTIKKAGIKIAVASNSIRDTLNNCLSSLGIDSMIDYTLSNEDVENPKPNPEIYIKAMQYLEATPSSTIIFEDSIVGQEAAKKSGARLVRIKNRQDLTFDKIFDSINYLNGVA